MLRGGQAIRMGLRAASRNPELAFGKALLELAGSVLSALPVLLAGTLIWRAIAGEEVLRGLLHAFRAVTRAGLPVAGALFAAAVISWALSAAFWAGALPVLAVDAEMNARPPPGIFWRLAFQGFARVLGASAVANLLSLLVAAALTAALLLGVPLFLDTPSFGLAVAVSALLACSMLTGLLIDLLGNFLVIRAAVLGDGITTAFARASTLFAARLWAALGIGAVFLVFDLVCATALGAFVGPALTDVSLNLHLQLFALGPRIALTIASTVVIAWIDVARQASLAALAADAEGLIELPPEPVRRAPVRRLPVQAWELRPQQAQSASGLRPVGAPPREEQVIEALPIAEAPEPVIEALPIDPTGSGPSEPST